MVEMVSRRLQQRLLSPGGSRLCGAMREAILTLCRDNLAYGGQVEVDGIICITGPHDGQQLVVKVHELLDNDKWAEKPWVEGGGRASGGGGEAGPERRSNSRPSAEDYSGEQQGTPLPHQGAGESDSPTSSTTPGTTDKTNPNCETREEPPQQRQQQQQQDTEQQQHQAHNSCEDTKDVDMERRDAADGEEREDDEGEEEPSISDHYGSEGVRSRQGGEVEALDLRLDSPAARIKQEPMEYEDHRYHPYGSSSSSSSIYPPSSTQDASRYEGSFSVGGTSVTTVGDDRDPAAEGGSGSRRANSSSPHTPHTPLLVPFLGPAHPHHPHPHPDMAETAFSTPPGSSPFMDSRLRHLLAKMPYTKPHPGLPFLHRRPLFPTMSVLHSGAPECKACGFTFAQVELLKEHNEAVHAVFTCSVCYRTFTSRSNLDRHSRLHTGHKPYICVKCGKAFSRKDHLTNHSAKHAFKCGKCLKRFVEREALQGHYDQDHQVALTNICEHCNKGFSDPAVFTEHLKSHPEYLGGSKIHPKHKPFACNECNYVCADKLQLLKHSQLHGESGQNLVYNCLACGESFGDPLLYSQHFEGHQDQTEIFECCICRKMCRTWRDLKQHEQSHLHPSSRGPTLACPVCYIIFDNPDVLSEHMQSHDPMELADAFPCNVCNEVFPSPEALQKHEQEEKHYVKKAFTSPHHPLSSPLASPMPHDGPSCSPGLLSTDRAFLSSVGDSDSNDSDEELDVIAVDESPFPAATAMSVKEETPPAKGEEPEKNESRGFVITENPMPVIEVANNSEAEAEASTSPQPAPAEVVPSDPPAPCRSQSASSSSSASSAFSASLSTLPPAPPSAAVFPDRSPLHHPPLGLSPPSLPPLPPHGPLSHLMAVHSPHPSPDPALMSSATPWLPSPYHNHNNSAYAFPPVGPPLTEYTCPLCDAKLMSFHDFETHCFSDHFRYPCMYCTKTFAQKANRDRHVCIHTGEKPYPCPECDQKFARGDKLKIHRTKWHNIQFPSTYNRPKDATGSGDWPSGRRREGSGRGDSDEMMTTAGSQKDGSSGQWSDPDSQDKLSGAGEGSLLAGHQSPYVGIKEEGVASTSASVFPE